MNPLRGGLDVVAGDARIAGHMEELARRGSPANNTRDERRPDESLVGGAVGVDLRAAMRIVIGLLFACHGAQKLFGVLGGEQRLSEPLPLAAGVIELARRPDGGLGLRAGYAAFIASGTMAVGYFMVHAPGASGPSRTGRAGRGLLLRLASPRRAPASSVSTPSWGRRGEVIDEAGGLGMDDQVPTLLRASQGRASGVEDPLDSLRCRCLRGLRLSAPGRGDGEVLPRGL